MPFATIGKVILALFAIWVIFELTTLITLMLVAIVLAIAFEPIVGWLERRGIPRWLGATASVLLVVVALVWFLSASGASLAAQARQVIDSLTSLQKKVVSALPPPLAKIWRGSKSATPDASDIAGYAVTIGTAVATGLIVAAIASILTVYLLVDGRRTWAWLVAYVPRRNRARVQMTADAAQRAILRYVAGNIATSIFAGVWVFASLVLLHVPAPLVLALLAAVCDFVPVLGFIVAAVPGVLLALTVSSTTGVIVAALYTLYHLLENYLIGPRVYGGTLRLSNLAVLLAFAVGAELFGVVGALLALPAAAMYPVIEDLWLREYLSRDAADTHRRIEREA